MCQAMQHVHFERIFGVTNSEVTAGVKTARQRTYKTKDVMVCVLPAPLYT